jgi:ATP-independent RNA helicase DbpA
MLEQILQNLKIASLNKMQLETIQAAKKEGDLMLLSPTGSGKTLGFLLPVFQRINQHKEGVQILILVPSRELAIQIEQVFKQMGTGFKVNCCYGGHSTKIERNNLEFPPAVLVGTPGRIAHHIRNNNFDTHSIHTLVLDEFDKSLEFGFQDDMSEIIGQLQYLKKRILTSATKLEEIPSFTGFENETVVNYLSDTPTKAVGLKLKLLRSDKKDKLDALLNLLCWQGSKSTLIFCNHRESVERVSDLLYDNAIMHDIFHGGMEQEDRERALIKFRNGSHQILVTTDLASRGLDIPEIESVVHYHLPLKEDAFIHRNGRTARMNAEGTSYLLLGADEELPDFITEVPEELTLPEASNVPKLTEWQTLYIAAGKKDKINKMDIVGMLCQKGNLVKADLGLIEVLDHTSYVAVKRDKIEAMLRLVRHEKIKGRGVRMEISK